MELSHADDLSDYTALGIGPVLNRNWKRRNALLGVRMNPDPDDITEFFDLDVERLRQMVEERFVPEWNGRAPCTSAFLAFMTEWPEVKAHGYAIHPWRTDYRITIRGLDCFLATVAPARRYALRVAFASKFLGAYDFVADESYLWAFWK